MKETTDTTPARQQVDGWCHWHKSRGKDVRLVQVIEQGSGPGYEFYGCAACRTKFHLAPFAEQR
ncbi:hypothetical protein ACWIG4_06360 [Streptomyces sp. NPDC002248]